MIPKTLWFIYWSPRKGYFWKWGASEGYHTLSHVKDAIKESGCARSEFRIVRYDRRMGRKGK